MKVLSRIFRGFKEFYGLLNILSIDVAVGACIMALFVAEIFNVNIPSVTLVALALSVWIIYTVDHLNDAKNIPHASHTQRHSFHQDHFIILRAAVIAAVGVQLVLLYFLPLTIIIKGFVMILVVIIYFLLLWLFKYKSIYHKEIVISLVYTSGVFLPTLNLLDFNISYQLLIVFFQVGSLAFCNLLIFALLEMRSDQLDHQSSIALAIGRVNTQRIIYTLLSIGLSLALVLLIVAESTDLRTAQVIFMLMYVLSAGILRISWFKKNERFRYCGDALFFIPLPHILWL